MPVPQPTHPSSSGRRASAIVVVATLLLAGAGRVAAQPLQCSNENPNLWALRFNLGPAISVAQCRAQCQQGGGNGYLCLSAATGMCLCGTSAKPQSTNPDVPGGCTVTCSSGDDLCGAPPSRYSCYAGPPPGPCPTSPRSGCSASSGTLRLQTRPYDQEYLRWWWARGTVAADGFGDPTTTTSYAVCVYADDRLIATEEIAPGAGWKRSRTGILRYSNPKGNADGITRVVLRPDDDRASIFVGGRGTPLDLPSPPLAYTGDVKVQLARRDAAACWETELASPARRNANGRFLDTE